MLISGERTESLSIAPDSARAAQELALLDAQVARRLERLARGPKVVALVKHQASGGARFALLDQALAALGFDDTTIVPGRDVPPGALALFLDVGAGPTRPAMESIDRHLAAGGAALVAIEPRKGSSLGPLEARLGLGLAAGSLVDPKAHAVARRDRTDHALVVTSSFTAHPSLATVGRLPAGVPLLFAGAGALVERDPPAGVTRVTTIRSMATAFLDLDGDLTQGRREQVRAHPIAAAASGPFKAIVIADAGWLSDEVLENAKADQALLADALRWLAGEEELVAEGIDQPASGDRLTVYPLRTRAVAGVHGALWKVAPDGVHGIRFESRGRTVLLERRDGALWARVERPSPDGTSAASVREFPLAPEAVELFAALAEPVPLRTVGPLDATARARFALDDGTLTVDLAGGATHTILIGSRVMGSGDHYAADAAGRSVVILPASLLNPIIQTDRIALRRVVDLDAAQLSRMAIVAPDGRMREAVKGSSGAWQVNGGDSDDAYLAEEVARAAFRLTPTEFIPADRAKEMTARGKVTLTAGSAPPVDLELFTRGEDFWVRTAVTRGLFGRVSAGSARRIADAIEQLSAAPP